MFWMQNQRLFQFSKLSLCNILFTGGELSSPKLAALQKVLQSDFCSAVREVYEHVYETVDISGSPEIRANATAKVCNPLAMWFTFYFRSLHFVFWNVRVSNIERLFEKYEVSY